MDQDQQLINQSPPQDQDGSASSASRSQDAAYDTAATDQPPSSDQSAEPDEHKNEAWEWIKALLLAGGLVILIRWFVFAPFVVSGISMEPSFRTGERLIVNKMIYSIRTPERGEVIVFHAPNGDDYIKRVIAFPGERVKIENNKVYINDQELAEPYIEEAVRQLQETNNGSYYNLDYSEVTVSEGALFVLGDNRRFSQDSREIGFIDLDEVIGRADIRFWPVNQLGLTKR